MHTWDMGEVGVNEYKTWSPMRSVSNENKIINQLINRKSNIKANNRVCF